jgi:ubiquinone/menaquinone biosynthesis C-methylase UbiE
MQTQSTHEELGTLGVSERLRSFVAEMPYERRSILDFLMRAASELPLGARVADVGAGDAPYRELFEHVDYVTVDWEQSPHEGARVVDVVASADAIPVSDESFDAVLLTQVLEHVPDPVRVLTELHRVLRPGGSMFLTAPLVWELHEMPFDYFRYTAPGLESLLERAGFERIQVEPRNDCFTTLAQLMRNVEALMGEAADGLAEQRRQVKESFARLAEEIAALAPLDTRMVFPLGFAASAVRPAAA